MAQARKTQIKKPALQVKSAVRTAPFVAYDFLRQRSRNQLQTLNYSTHCLENWSENFDHLEPGDADPLLLAIIRSLAKVIAGAPKFQLSDGGRPMNDEKSITRMFSSLRLPFPCVVLEYAAIGPVSAKEVTSSKRLAIVWDLQHGSPAIFTTLTAKSLSARPGLLVQSVSYVNSHDIWMPIMGMIEIDTQSPVSKIDDFDEAGNEFFKELVEHRIERDGNKPLISYPVTVYPTHPAIFDQVEMPSQVTDVLIADSGDEVLSAISFGALTACANVTSEVIKAPALLNKKRLAKNKTPFFDVRILAVEDGGYSPSTAQGKSTATGGHASPRTHLRRGHIRKLPEKVIWVNAALVNPGSDSLKTPTYKLNTKASRDN